jgi:hypothetical protein
LQRLKSAIWRTFRRTILNTAFRIETKKFHIFMSSFFAEAEICQLADIQENIQKMREGELGDRQRLEARLSSSCPALAVEAAANKRRAGRHHAQRHRRRSDRHRRQVGHLW